MKLTHKALTGLLQKAYSAEKAAAFAYQGHAGAVKDNDEKIAVRQIELDEWKTPEGSDDHHDSIQHSRFKIL
ncbi:MAG: hypothetical protein WDO15_24950 [Bacteroidota bacterium]